MEFRYCPTGQFFILYFLKYRFLLINGLYSKSLGQNVLTKISQTLSGNAENQK